jgi:hypothetical protein
MLVTRMRLAYAIDYVRSHHNATAVPSHLRTVFRDAFPWERGIGLRFGRFTAPHGSAGLIADVLVDGGCWLTEVKCEVGAGVGRG